ncbi:hypothetical protein L211DRAFT_781996 [Terfezia boudieri ATCC MYA-4762]|uniref:Amine oxidase n=1 Tax=Terfezia boudieri ATCC MYA-4762 TaxID=1051890 RepID=A0A3N4M8V8_9PEZI|nr:hypothetical protein L211DRAFT_781996 [Terfezia boudieri ATCC MYA-4762]
MVASPEDPGNFLSNLAPHPLDQLSTNEIDIARDVVLQARLPASVVFRNTALEEPTKKVLLPYLVAERNGKLNDATLRPPRLARVLYDIVTSDAAWEFCDSVVNVETSEEVFFEVVEHHYHAPLSGDEIRDFPEIVRKSTMFQEALIDLSLPDNVIVVIDPWMYGGCSSPGSEPRYMQGLVYTRDPATNDPDSNHYAFPLPIIPVVNMATREVVRVDKLCTGGVNDGFQTDTHPQNAIGHCESAEYIPELVSGGLRQDLKPLNVHQPEGASFHVTGNLVQWQKWRFRVGFNYREGATLHDILYEGRSIFYRISYSEMSVPYGDPRPPYHRKQAFDFGDGGAGRATNSLQLGCDCLGVIKYFDAVMSDGRGKGMVVQNVICMHEQDNGIGWKHSNYRTGRAVVTRNRLLIVQFVITLANYEYVFAYNFDQAGGLAIETRATGIVSTVPIDPGKTSLWGNVVHPGVLAQNHQHLFCVRIDPWIEGPQNTVLYEESHVLPWNEETNPHGNGYEVRQTVLKKSGWADAAPHHNRVFKIVNPNHLNPISGRPVGYKFALPATQLMLAHPESLMGKRAAYAMHHIWVTKYRDHEYWAAGRWTNQGNVERGGVRDMVDRGENTENEDIVLWHSFGLTHNPRVEDFPVMPVEIYTIQLKPADFFTRNPAIDVPSTKNVTSQYYEQVSGIVRANGHTKCNEQRSSGINGCCGVNNGV